MATWAKNTYTHPYYDVTHKNLTFKISQLFVIETKSLSASLEGLSSSLVLAASYGQTCFWRDSGCAGP